MKINRVYRDTTLPKEATCVFEGVLFDVYQWEQELYDGTKTTFEKLVRADAVVALPVLIDGRIVLVKDEQPGRGPYLRAPGGSVEGQETPEDAIRRELKEELGYECASLTTVATRKPEDKIDWMVYSFVAHGCTQVVEPRAGSGERITPHPVTFDEFIELGKQDMLHSEWKARIFEALLVPQKMEELKHLLSV